MRYNLPVYLVFFAFTGYCIKYPKLGGIYMKKYVCDLCGYVYDPADGDPDNGVQPGTAFADIPEDWVCPLCGAAKSDFSPEE